MTDNTALAQKLEALLAAYRKPNSETSAAFALRSHLVAHIDTILTALRTPAPAPVGDDVVEPGEKIAARLCDWDRDGEPPVPLMQEAARFIRAALQHPAPASDEVKKVAEEARCYCVASEGICLPDDPCGPCKAADMLERFASRPTAQPSDLVERVAKALAKADGLDFDEVCGVDANPDDGYCDSGTCVAAFYEDHDADHARGVYMRHARAAIAAMQGGDAVLAERERCAKIAEAIPTDWRDGTQPGPLSAYRHACREIAAAIRGGA